MYSSLLKSQWRKLGIKALSLTALLVTAITSHATPDRVTVAWDPNPEPDIAGYRVYFGVVGAGITNVLSPSMVTRKEVYQLRPTTQYWFYVTAFNTAGLESDPSQVLTYTTPINAPPTLELGADRMAIVPSTITLVATATDDWLTPDRLFYAWYQTAGPAVPITGASTQQASMAIQTAGTYRFNADVDDDLHWVSDSLLVHAVQRTENPPPGAVVPDINTMLQTFDGLVLGWNSAQNVSYIVAFKETLNESTWRILDDNVTSMGVVTYWVDELGGFGQQGFYGIFQKP